MYDEDSDDDEESDDSDEADGFTHRSSVIIEEVHDVEHDGIHITSATAAKVFVCRRASHIAPSPIVTTHYAICTCPCMQDDNGCSLKHSLLDTLGTGTLRTGTCKTHDAGHRSHLLYNPNPNHIFMYRLVPYTFAYTRDGARHDVHLLTGNTGELYLSVDSILVRRTHAIHFLAACQPSMCYFRLRIPPQKSQTWQHSPARSARQTP